MQKVSVVSLGCAKNLVHSETMMGLFQAYGYELTERYDEAEALYKVAIAAEQAAHQQYLLAKAGAQKQDKESARSLVDAAQGTVNEVQSVLRDAWLTAPMDGEIATIYAKCGELVGTGTPIMNLVAIQDCHVVLNVREDYLPSFGMGQSFVGKVPALRNKEVVFKVNYISPLGSFATWESTGTGKNRPPPQNRGKS